MRAGKFVVFVCHSHHGDLDKQEARRLRRFLEAHRIGTFVSSTEAVPAGEDWKAYTERVLMDCRLFVIIVTAKCLVSRECRDELNMAVRHNKKILPVFLDREPPLIRGEFDDAFLKLNDRQAITVKGDVDDEDRYKVLAALGQKSVAVPWPMLGAAALLVTVGLLGFQFFQREGECGWTTRKGKTINVSVNFDNLDSNDPLSKVDTQVWARQNEGAPCRLPQNSMGHWSVAAPSSDERVEVWASTADQRRITDVLPVSAGDLVLAVNSSTPTDTPEE